MKIGYQPITQRFLVFSGSTEMEHWFELCSRCCGGWGGWWIYVEGRVKTILKYANFRSNKQSSLGVVLYSD